MFYYYYRFIIITENDFSACFTLFARTLLYIWKEVHTKYIKEDSINYHIVVVYGAISPITYTTSITGGDGNEKQRWRGGCS